MIEINVGYTAPINPSTLPPSAPRLTIPQVWRGLQRKVTHAHEFVPIITGCRILSEAEAATHRSVILPAQGTSQVVTRLVTFRPGTRPGVPPSAVSAVQSHLGLDAQEGVVVREECIMYEPCRVDFLQDDGTKIANYVTVGAGGEEEGDLYMTYVFQWILNDVEGGGEEEKRLRKTYQEVSYLFFFPWKTGDGLLTRHVVIDGQDGGRVEHSDD